MTLLEHFRMMATYNRLANEELYAACAKLSDEAYRKKRNGSFGSIHALLNHLLLSDRIWMARFEGGGETTPPLDTILCESFAELHAARLTEDARIECFFDEMSAEAFDDFLGMKMRYINSRGAESVSIATLAVPHLFTHQTHHRAQVHVMLGEAGVQPPSLDLHRLVGMHIASQMKKA